MKNLTLLLLTLVSLGSLNSFATSRNRIEKIDGVPFRCINAIRYELIRQFAVENKEDQGAVAEYRDYIRSAAAYGCRRRDNRNVEDVSWCDGSGCSGATATFKQGKCTISDAWFGQDDQDYVDEDEQAKTCLTKKDF